ncbi:MAG: helix-turn-helix transcriptional regulator [Chloroflexi bacterium]|nr:helix-turn-helix transcriptional regulator [Chloroflexota bacterium]
MIVKTRIFDLPHNGYKNLSELAQAMKISVSQIYRVREGKRRINQKFIVGAIKAFPNYKLDDLFYLAPDVSAVHDNYRQRHSIKHSAAQEKSSDREKRLVASIW